MSAAPESLAKIPSFDPRQVPVEGRDIELPAVAAERLSERALRERFLRPPAWEAEFAGDRFRLRPEPPRPAAVLVPIVAHDSGTTVLLTERTSHLHDHAGQVAFPGGRTDPGDASAVHTALREAQEEIGLTPDFVEVLGELPQYLTGTGYRVTPVVAVVRPGFDLQLDEFEVAQAFEVPLEFLMNPRHHERRRVVYGDIDRVFYSMPYRRDEREFFIWGATAAMLRNLYRMLAA
jgi:8-oxo-dGTP pyrophosphatase MutT (NUDIX family)